MISLCIIFPNLFPHFPRLIWHYRLEMPQFLYWNSWDTDVFLQHCRAFVLVQVTHFYFHTKMFLKSQKFHVIHRWSSTNYQQFTFRICRRLWHQCDQCLKHHIIEIRACLHKFHDSINVVNHNQRRFRFVSISENLVNTVNFSQRPHPHKLLWRNELYKFKLWLIGKLWCNRCCTWTLFSMKHHCVQLMGSCQCKSLSCLQVAHYVSELWTVVENFISQKYLEVLLITAKAWWDFVDSFFKVQHCNCGTLF